MKRSFLDKESPKGSNGSAAKPWSRKESWHGSDSKKAGVEAHRISFKFSDSRGNTPPPVRREANRAVANSIPILVFTRDPRRCISSFCFFSRLFFSSFFFGYTESTSTRSTR